MSRLKFLFLALTAICALSAVVASSAMAEKCPAHGKACLPLVHVLEGEKFPLLLEAVTKGKQSSFLETANGAKLEAEELKLLLDITELGSLGTFDAHFVNVTEAGATEEKKCSTAGDASGVVLVKGEAHLVWSSTEKLNLLLLFLVPAFELTCKNAKSETKVKTEGSILSELKPEASGKDVTSIGSKTLCKEAGIQELSTYLNENEETLKASLKTNLGGKLQSACEQATENPLVGKVKGEAGEATMFVPLW